MILFRFRLGGGSLRSSRRPAKPVCCQAVDDPADPISWTKWCTKHPAAIGHFDSALAGDPCPCHTDICHSWPTIPWLTIPWFTIPWLAIPWFAIPLLTISYAHLLTPIFLHLPFLLILQILVN
jgi:hypothetical protein